MSKDVIERRKPRNTKEAIIQIYDILVDVQKDLKAVAEKQEKQNGRVSQLERWQSFIGGVSSVVGLLIGYFLKSLPEILKNH